MKVILKDGRRYMLRFDKGEDVMAELKNFAMEQEIKAAVVSGIGATDEILVSWFHPEEKKYHDHLLTKKLEIVNFQGNIAMLDGAPIIHAHGSFSDVELHGRAGHIKKLIVSSTCEVFMIAMDGEIQRGFDEATGLHLMQ